MKIPIKNFIKFYSKAKTIYNIHSPFVFEFFNEVMDTSRVYYHFPIIEKVRSQLLSSKEVIEVLDLGAGGTEKHTYQKSINKIASSSLSSKIQCRMLFNIVNHYKTENILEMGTSLGVSSMYLAAPDSRNKVISLEGNPSSARIARRNFKSAGYENIEVIEGAFDDTLTSTLMEMKRVDLAFIDGNHRYEPTMKYFESILPYCHEESIMIFDDIYWSEEMKKTWDELKVQPEVTLSIDLFFMGILFFKNLNTPRQGFQLIQSKFKPFSFGIFG